MANIPLQSITFPGLADKYTTPVVDNTLTQAGAAADAKKTGDEIGAIKNDLSEFPNGTYPNMSVGNADQLTATVGIEDNTPYLFRTSGGSVDIGDREDVRKIVGGTIVNNQLIENNKAPSSTDWNVYHGTLSAGSDYSTYTVTELSSAISIVRSITKPAHKYLFSIEVNPAHTKGVRIYGIDYKTNPSRLITATAGIWNEIGFVFGVSSDADAKLRELQICLYCTEENGYSVGDTDLVRYFRLADLTQMLGTTIADYVYSLEQTTAGAGVAWLKKHFPKQFDAGYQAYDAASLQSVSGLTAHKMVGFNQWDEVWEAGTFNSSNGKKAEISGRIRTKNYIPVVPNTNYYVFVGNGYGRSSLGTVCYYDADKNFVSAAYPDANTQITTPNNACYMMIGFYVSYGATYNHDICINLHWDGERDGEYEPYVEYTYPLDSDVVLRGIPKVDANGNLYYDGDEYLPDGTINRRYGIVDLGTLNWTMGTFNDITYFTVGSSQLPDLKKPTTSSTDDNNYRCGKYALVKASGVTVEFVDKSFFVYTNGVLYFRDDSYNDATAFKTAMSGVYLVYELDAPTTETALPYQETQIVDDFGTEEFVLADGTFPVPVGHNTMYQNNLRAKLEMSPESPDGDGLYVVQQESGENTYVPLASTATIQDILTRLTALENA